MREQESVARPKLDLFKVASLSQLRLDHDRCVKAQKTNYDQHLAQSLERNKRIDQKYGVPVYPDCLKDMPPEGL